MSLAEASTAGTRTNEATRFKSGVSGNPGGFPASKRKLAKKFLNELLEDFDENGASAIVDFREKHVDKYCALIADLIPAEATINVKGSPELVAGLERLSGDIDWIRGAVESARAKAAASLPEPERSLLPAPLHAEKG